MICRTEIVALCLYQNILVLEPEPEIEYYDEAFSEALNRNIYLFVEFDEEKGVILQG